MPDDLRAWLHTTVPAAWSALVTWLISLDAPPWGIDALGDAGPAFVVPLVLGAIYAGLRALEPRMRPWLTRVLLGSNIPPIYSTAGSGQ